MKKYLGLSLVVALVVVCLCGCANLEDNNFPDSAYPSYVETTNKANTALANSCIQDFSAFIGETNLVAYTIERDVSFRVDFLYDNYSNGRVYNLPTIEHRVDLMNQFEYRELYKANLTLTVLDTLDEYSLNESGDIVGVIVSWKRVRDFSDDEYYSVCDFDGDGTWDYCLKGTSLCGTLQFVEKTVVDGPSRTIDQQEIVMSVPFQDMVVELSDLTGKETFHDIEKLYKRLLKVKTA